VILDDAPDATPCAVCDKSARERVHRGCRERMAEALKELPQLYRQLADALQPARRSDGPAVPAPPAAASPAATPSTSGPAAASKASSAAGPATSANGSSWDVPAYQSVQAIVDWSCAILLANLAIICDEHPAVKELAHELASIRGQAERLITGEQPPRKVGVACPCGNTLRVTLDTAGVKCPACSAQYGHSEALRLPLAERRAA
jgi:hypothetical protein